MSKRKYDTTGRDMIRTYLADCEAVADFGCGPKKIRPNAVGFDHDPDVHPDFVEDITYLAFIPDQTYDGIAMSHFLEHVVDVRQFLKECLRILTLGGRIAICCPHGEQVDHETLGDSNKTHERLFTERTLCTYLRHAGFANVSGCTYNRPWMHNKSQGLYAHGERPQ